MGKVDVAIIGNGVLGCSLTFALLQENSSATIALIGPAHDRLAASPAAGAMLNSFAEITASTLESDAGRCKFEMGRKANDLWPQWLDKINSLNTDKNLSLIINHGTYVILNTSADEMDDSNFTAIKNALDEYKEPYTEISPDEIKGLNPDPRRRALKALYIPNENSMNINDLLRSFSEVFQKNEYITLVNGKVFKVERDENHLFHLHYEQGVIVAKQIVLCAGAQTQELLDSAEMFKMNNHIPRMVYGIGTAMVLEPSLNEEFKHVIRTINRGMACGIHVVPRENLLYVGASNYISPYSQKYSTATSSYFLLQGAMEQINKDYCTAHIVNWYLGCRPITIDTFPLIGQTSIPGLWILSGTYRDGIHSSPYLAINMAKQILGKTTDFQHPFQPVRNAISTRTIDQSVAEAVKHYVSGAYQHELQLPKMQGWNQLVKKALEEKFLAVYDELEIDFGVPPEILVMYSRHTGEFLKKIKLHYQMLAKN